MQHKLSKKNRTLALLSSWFVDHEILRKLYRNFYKLSANAFRSNHPSPAFLKKLKNDFGLKTVISLRKADTSGSYLLEKEACEKFNIKLINIPLSSHKFPTVENILDAKKALETAEYPILIHCKSGADRAGLMSVLYKHFIEGQPIKKAVKQLSIRFGHFRWADTGKLDLFFESYLAFQKTHPEIDFLDWLTNHYDKAALKKEFESAGWANMIVHKILHRE